MLDAPMFRMLDSITRMLQCTRTEEKDVKTTEDEDRKRYNERSTLVAALLLQQAQAVPSH